MLRNGHMTGFSDLLICFAFGVCQLQAAATRSLAQGTTLDKVLDMLKQVDILVCLFVFPFFNKFDGLCSSNKAYKWPRECEHSSFLCRWCPIWRHQWFSLHITTQSWSVVQKFSWRLSRQLVHQVCFSLHLILSCCLGSKHNTYISDAFENSRVH